MQVALFVLAILLLIGLVLLHEFGHFLIARRNGVVAEEFGLGFPPRAWKRKLKSGLVLSLNWLPLGGFVNLKGQHDGDTERGSFGAASLGAKARILLAGVGMNAVAGLVLLTILALVGLPVLITKDSVGEDQFTVASDTKIVSQTVAFGDILSGSPAYKAGFKSTDTIVSLRNSSRTVYVSTPGQLHDATQSFAGQTVEVSYKRAGQLRTQSVRLLSAQQVNASLKTNNPKGYLGVVPQALTIRRSTWSAPLVALGFTKQLCWLTLKGIGHAIAGLGSIIAAIATDNHQARENGQAQASSQVGGPLAIGKILWGSGSLGINFTFMFTAVISITLALVNLLPIPVLDGGRLALILVTRAILRRPLKPKTEELAVSVSMAMIFALIILISIADVNRFY